MKIAVDISVLYIAGAGVFYYRYNLLRAMLSLPMEHDLVLVDYFPVGEWARNDPPEVKELLSTGVEVRRITGLKHRRLERVGFVQRRGLTTWARRVDDLLADRWRQLSYFEMNRRLRRHLSDVALFHSSDVVHCALPHAKNVATLYDLTAIIFPAYHTPLVRRAQAAKHRFVQKHADAVITISESARRDAIEHLGLDPDRVFVIYGGVDPAYRPLPREYVAETLKAWGLSPQNYILNLGTIEPRKNLVRLLQAYDRMRHRTPGQTIKLVQVGMRGWQYDDVFAQADALDFRDDVVFLGRVESSLLPALYNGALMFVYPSLYEGFGLPALEAMACGTPVIAGNVSSLPEVVGEAGVLVDPYDVERIAEAMVELLEDGRLRERLGRLGVERAARFSWRATAEKTVAVYENLLRS